MNVKHLFPDSKVTLSPTYSHLNLKEYLKVLIDYLEKYKFLTSLHIVDFITKDQWNVIPKEWQEALLPNNNTMDHEEWLDSIIQITSGLNGIKTEWPESLVSFIKETEKVSLPRVNQYGNQMRHILDKRITSGMIEKKIHEVERMTPVIQSMAKEHNVESIVDLGAGQGYLSRSIAFKSGLKVLAVDSSEIQTCGAKKFDQKVIKRFDQDALKLHHVTDFITPENASTILSKWSDSKEKEDWLLCGLHTCGDLASMMLRLFTSSQDMTCLVDVGCCYHFLTERPMDSDQDITNFGFPLSQDLCQSNYYLGPRALMLSCQAPARWVDQRQETLIAYEHHFFRSLLHFIMVEKGLAQVSFAPVLGRLNKKKDFTSFSVYVAVALKRLNLPKDSITPEEAERYYSDFKSRKVDKQIIILWTLRVLLGPVIESIILIDRCIYLDESLPETQTKSVWLWPLFDPIASPRNMVVVATK